MVVLFYIGGLGTLECVCFIRQSDDLIKYE